MEQYLDKFKLNIIRGAKIYDLYETIKASPGIPKDVDFLLINNLGKKVNLVELTAFEKDHLIIEYISKKLAYKKISKYIKQLFEMKSYSKKEFKLKTFRGSKIVELYRFLSFEIQHCDRTLEMYNEYPALTESLKIVCEKQRVIYFQILELIVEGFFNEKIKQSDFLDIWIEKNLINKEEEEL